MCVSAIPYPMTSRQRFRETMRRGRPDRVPYLEEGIRPAVLDAWRRQGLGRDQHPYDRFPTDSWLEIQPDLDPRPDLPRWPTAAADLATFEAHLDPDDPHRLPADLTASDRTTGSGDEPVRILRVHRGFFLSMGVLGWDRFRDLMRLAITDPQMVRRAMEIQGVFAARLAGRVLSRVAVDAAVFSEPIGGNTGPLISPRMYAELVLPAYRPLIERLQGHGVKTLIFRTYANARALIGPVLEAGFNCLWACEVHLDAMDYRDLRREYGKKLRLIGGIDLDALRRGPDAIRAELTTRLPPLLADGGYIPLADGRIREDIAYEDYVAYRRLLRQVVGSFDGRGERDSKE